MHLQNNQINRNISVLVQSNTPKNVKTAISNNLGVSYNKDVDKCLGVYNNNSKSRCALYKDLVPKSSRLEVKAILTGKINFNQVSSSIPTNVHVSPLYMPNT